MNAVKQIAARARIGADEPNLSIRLFPSSSALIPLFPASRADRTTHAAGKR